MFSSLPHPRGSDLLTASSDVAQQHELSTALSEQRLWETSPGASAQGFRAIFKLRPWPGLLCQSVHCTPFSLQPEPALLPFFRYCGNSGRGPCLQPLSPTLLCPDTQTSLLGLSRAGSLTWSVCCCLHNTLSKHFHCPSMSQFLWLQGGGWRVGQSAQRTHVPLRGVRLPGLPSYTHIPPTKGPLTAGARWRGSWREPPPPGLHLN